MASKRSLPAKTTDTLTAKQLLDAKKNLRKIGIATTEDTTCDEPQITDSDQPPVQTNPESEGKAKPPISKKPTAAEPHAPSAYSSLDNIYKVIETKVSHDIYKVTKDFSNDEINLKKNAEVIILAERSADYVLIEDERQNKRALIPRGILMKPERLECYSWYQGFINRKEAEQYLAQTGKDGAFLIRAKEKEGRTTYVLSVQSEHKGAYQRDHYEIKNPTQGDRTFYYINRSNEFSTLQQLVKHFSETSDGLQTKLKYPRTDDKDDDDADDDDDYMKPSDKLTETTNVAPNPVPGRPLVHVQPQPQQTQATPDRSPKNKPKKEKPPTPQDSQNVAETDKLDPNKDNKYSISGDRIDQLEKIGGGQFAEIYKGKFRETDTKEILVAIKIFKTKTGIDFEKEMKVLKTIKSHPNLVSFYGYSTTLNGIVLELVPKGDLKKYLYSKKPKFGKPKINVAKSVGMVFQISDGMRYLESMSVVHRDLAARNILLVDDHTVKITDFGLSREIDKIYIASEGSKVPVKWTSPEGLRRGEFTSMSDVWSFGMVLLEIFTLGDDPFPNLGNDEINDILVQGDLPPHPRPEGCPSDLYEDIMLKCWRTEPLKRPAFEVICPYLKQYVAKMKRTSMFFS